MNNEEFNSFEKEQFPQPSENIEDVGRIFLALDDSSNDLYEAAKNCYQGLRSLGALFIDKPDIFSGIVHNEIVLSISFLSKENPDDYTDIDMHKVIPVVVKELISEELAYEEALVQLDKYVYKSLEEKNPSAITKFVIVFLKSISVFLCGLEDEPTVQETPFEDSTVFKEFIDSLDDKDQPV